jgi:hypothetical protein
MFRCTVRICMPTRVSAADATRDRVRRRKQGFTSPLPTYSEWTAEGEHDRAVSSDDLYTYCLSAAVGCT